MIQSSTKTSIVVDLHGHHKWTHEKEEIQDTIIKIHVWPYVQEFTAKQSALSTVDTCHNTHN